VTGRVLHYVPRWLPTTERFVAEQIGRSRWPGPVVSRHRPVDATARVRRTISLAALRSDRAVSLAVPALVAAVGADVVHVHFGYRLRDARRVLGRRPLVVSLFGHDVTGFRRDWPTYYAPVLGRVDAVVVPSSFLGVAAVDAGAAADRVHVVPPGVDTAFFAPAPPPDGSPEVAFVGRFVEKKGLDVLLEAWPQVRRAVPEARLRLVGAGPLEPLARRAAGGDVEVVVRTGREEVRDALRRATVVCTPSRTASDGDAESLLLVNLEAQAVGRPVVTTRHAAVPEFVAEGETALVVDEGAAAPLAEALVTVLRDAALAARLGAAGPRFAAGFDVAVTARRVDDEVYAPLVTARR
jgi:colanic acid/amylovoran biosynthesis glycosyltransferase